ncbi:discoidin domain-containing protein [Echinicola salinicaeni]|uniref:discoidin domain-containing protein n=1 Tax=Echinicola salinicaeni TaxID=2762757 RepID=UPI0016472157|nr:discoidin domain-containing protein [Echinicola salinicaeni]
MKMKKSYFSWLALPCLAAGMMFSSCSEEGMIGAEGNEVVKSQLSLPYQKQLNVVYFLPNDMEPHAEYERRLSGALKHIQGYYGQELLSHGFGNRSFGLEEHDSIPGFVKIHLIEAKEDRYYYPYNGGGRRAIEEIKEYFAQHPEEQTSDHFLVFLPASEEVGVPFYGIGKFAFTRDYAGGYDMDKWVEGEGFPTRDDRWLGGTIHELGHGLNLPHNRQKVSDNFIAMMGNGNSRYWSNPSGIKFTKASALILRYNQLFTNNAEFEFYDQNPNLVIKHKKIYADEEYLYVQAKFTSEVDTKGVIVYNDPKTSPSDGNYNAISWTSRDIIETASGQDSVSFKMALADIDEQFKQYPFKLNMRFVHENGRFSNLSHDYSFVNGKPDIVVDDITYDDLDKTNWSVIDFSSQEDDFEDSGWAYHMIDNDIYTVWHSGWYGSQPTPPHHITVDMADSFKINGVSIVQNQKATNAMLMNFTVYVSEDNSTWTNAGDFLASANKGRQQFIFDESVIARYIKIVAHDSYGSPVGVRIAELGAF